ncbi:MAG: response regulator transcription factor [Rhodocyclaceae bacterium]
MGEQLFITGDGQLRDLWREAFPAARALRPADKLDESSSGPIWLLVPPGQAAARLVVPIRRRIGQRPLIILADEPGEEDALAALGAGASGYCNAHAAPEVLQQVATVVENGGLWVGQRLLQRLLTGTARLVPPPVVEGSNWSVSLTEREREVAIAVAQGASNKEIARQLDITERTIKAHVGAILEKLAVRDRLQLSLIVNGIEISR